MGLVKSLGKRLIALVRKDQIERELDEEFRFHIELRTQANIDRGMSPLEAKRKAERRFGNVSLIKELGRDVRGGGWVEALLKDLQYGFRMLRRQPGFALVAILTLALGIGANTAIFSVVNTVLLRPLPYKDQDRLMVLWERQPQIDKESPSYPDFQDWRERSRAFDQIAAARRDSFNLTGSGEPEHLLAREVSGNLFNLLGVTPQLGRTFLAEEDRPQAQPTVVISHNLWQRKFGGQIGIVGQNLTLNDRSFTVIGVLAPSFQFYSPADIYVPFSFAPEWVRNDREEHGATVVVARLKPGISQPQAFAELDNIASNLDQEHPETNKDIRATVTPIYADMVGGVRTSLLMLLGAVAFVLLIACANVANLLLARSAARQREIAIRLALGAGRLRIIRQLLTESVLLSLIGGVLGLLLAQWGKGFLLAAIPSSLPWVKEIGLDRTVLAFTLLASLLTGIIFGLAPAFQATKPDLNETLKEGTRGSTGGSHRIRSLLVISEVALALMLLIGAGLMLKSFSYLLQIEPGFKPNNVLTMRFFLSPNRYNEATRARSFYTQVIDRVKSLPGVQAAALTSAVPLDGATVNDVQPEGRPAQRAGEVILTVRTFISPDYFRSMGINLLQGRAFTDRDNEKSPLTAIIDDRMARDLFTGTNPIGQYLLLNEGTVRAEIVGVVNHLNQLSWDGATESKIKYGMYMPFTQIPNQFFTRQAQRMSLVLRTSPEPSSLIAPVRNQVSAIDPDQPIADIKTMDNLVGDSVSERRFAMLLLTLFSAVALLLAVIGIYGVMSYSVAQRRHEIGIRIALGAGGGAVVKLIIWYGLRLVLIGIAVGLAGAFLLTRAMAALLFDVKASDPVTFLGVAGLLTGIAILACYLPARRAMKINPIVALRAE